MGVRVETMERKDGRVSLQGVVDILAREKYLSLMIEAGSKINWSVLESGIAIKSFSITRRKFWEACVAPRRGRGPAAINDAIRVRGVRLHTIAAG